MEATVVKKYNLNREECKALEMTKEVLNQLCREGFEDDFSYDENVCIINVINALDRVLDNDGEDWI